MPNIIEITDFSAPELDVYARLTQAQLRNRLEPEKGVFIAESPKVIARALTDEAFRTRLEQDPRETIETELQCKVSGDVTFKVREEENPGEMTILLPKLPKKEMGEQLTDREIDDIVAAGNIGIAVGIVTTDIVLVKGIA